MAVREVSNLSTLLRDIPGPRNFIDPGNHAFFLSGGALSNSPAFVKLEFVPPEIQVQSVEFS